MQSKLAPIWNPFQQGYMENPFEQFRLLRQQNPVHRGISGRWMLFRYDDVKLFLTSPLLRTLKISEIVSSKNRFLPEDENFDHLTAISKEWLLFLDPPEHTELRAAILKLWHSYDVREYITEVVNSTLEQFADLKEVDIVRDFAMYIPSRVICRMLGLPAEDYLRLRDWAYHFIRVLETFESIYALKRFNQKAGLFIEYLESVIAEKRRQPDEAFISRFLMANQTFKQPLDDKQLISALCVLFFAGIETSVNLFSQSILLLLNNPQQAALVRENEVLSANAVDELIRYITPTQYTKRVALEDIEIGGQRIKKGEMIMAALASANRDPEVFDNPEELNLRREKNPHLSFGHGLHFCVGARLAREELSLSLSALFRHFPDMAQHPQKKVEWDKLVVNRTLRSLPIVLSK
jgi:cytochrome P450